MPTKHLSWLRQYIIDKRPDVIIQGGDWNDYHSLSAYDQGRKPGEGARVMEDYNFGKKALDLLMDRWPRSYKPKLVHTLGNHENRVFRFENDNPRLEGCLPHPSQYFIDRGWKVIDFLQPIKIDGVYYCHYFCRNAQGKVTNSKTGQPSALLQAKREMVSTIAGHKQGYDSAMLETSGGRVRAIIAGSFYMHSESYLSPQGNNHWQGCLFLNDVHNGDYDLCEVSLRFLKRTYG